MKNIPNKIYLQTGTTEGDFEQLRKTGEITWNSERVNDSDIEYVRDCDDFAIKFAEWVGSNFESEHFGLWYRVYNKEENFLHPYELDDKTYTTEQLLNIYKNRE